MTVKSRPTALLEVNPQIQGYSAYNLDQLPPGAPSLAAFGPLPITPSASQQSGVAGKYAVQASATGYGTQSFNKDVTSGNQTHNFALVP